MSPLLVFVAKLVVSSGLLSAFYFLLFRGKSPLMAARVFLLCIPVVSLVASVVEIEAGGRILSFSSLVEDARTARTVPEKMSDDASPVPEYVAFRATEEFTAEDGTHLAVSPLGEGEEEADALASGVVLGRMVAPAVYLAVIFLLAAIITRQMLTLGRIRHRAEKRLMQGSKTYFSDEIKTAFSVLRSIYVNPRITDGRLDIVIGHEKQHIAHRHYVDLAIMELFTLVMWFNPFVWIIRREIRSVHEFQADRGTLAGGVAVRDLMLAILEETAGVVPVMANPFRSSMIKKRFLKMKTPGKIRFRALRVALTVPFMASTMLFFAFKSAAPAPAPAPVPAAVSALAPAAANETAMDHVVAPVAPVSADQKTAAVEVSTIPGNAETATYDLLQREESPEPSDLLQREDPPAPVHVSEAVDTKAFKMIFDGAKTSEVDLSKMDSLFADMKIDPADISDVSALRDIGIRIISKPERIATNPETEETRPARPADFPLEFDFTDHGLALTSDGRVVDVDGVQVDWPLGPAMQDILKFDAKVISAKNRTFVNARQHSGSPSKILRIERSEKETRLVLAANIYWPENWLFSDRGTCIVDQKTGDRYMIRDVEGDQELSRECILRGLQGRVVEIVMVFPPLDKNVKVVDIYEPDNFTDVTSGNNGGGMFIKDVRLSDYEHKPEKPRGRIIR